MASNISKRTKNLLALVACILVVAWSASVVYSVVSIYVGAYYVDEYGLSSRLSTHEIVAVIAMVILFILAAWGYDLLRSNTSPSLKTILTVLFILGCTFIIPFILTVLFFIGHVTLVLLK